MLTPVSQPMTGVLIYARVGAPFVDRIPISCTSPRQVRYGACSQQGAEGGLRREGPRARVFGVADDATHFTRTQP